jgi:hypothetical protein
MSIPVIVRSLFLLLTLELVCMGRASALLSEEALQEMQRKAPEQLTIQVIGVTKSIMNSDKRLDVRLEAKVLKVGRSAAGLKIGQVISIRYEAYDPIPDGIFGALGFGVLKKGKTYPAFLEPWDQRPWLAKPVPGVWFQPAAHDSSFSPLDTTSY